MSFRIQFSTKPRRLRVREPLTVVKKKNKPLCPEKRYTCARTVAVDCARGRVRGRRRCVSESNERTGRLRCAWQVISFRPNFTPSSQRLRDRNANESYSDRSDNLVVRCPTTAVRRDRSKLLQQCTHARGPLRMRERRLRPGTETGRDGTLVCRSSQLVRKYGLVRETVAKY